MSEQNSSSIITVLLKACFGVLYIRYNSKLIHAKALGVHAIDSMVADLSLELVLLARSLESAINGY